MIVVARHSGDNKPMNLTEISRLTAVSRHYLEQVTIHLKNAGLLKTLCGKNGGYMLTRPARSITADEIIEAAIGKINIVDCVNQPGSCPVADTCECREVYHLVNRQIKTALSSFKLDELARQKEIPEEEYKPALA
jgi:Rrf2 family protein